MATIGTILNKFKALSEPEVIAETFERSVDAYSDENKKQLFEGYNREGKRLQRYASNKYARVKNEMNPVPGLGNPDLFVTGAFTNSRRITISGNHIVTDFSDSKAPDLLQKYSDIDGLGGQYRKEFIDKNIRPTFRQIIREKTNL